MSVRKTFGGVLTVLLVLLMAGPSQGMDLGQGYLDLRWGARADSLGGFEAVGSKGRVDFYVNPQVVHTIGDVAVSDEIYGFFDGRFFAAYLNIDSIEVFGQLKEYLNSKYGTPDMSMSMKNEETIYKWKHEEVKVKLKLQQTSGRMKLGFYYQPIARQLDEAELEGYTEKGIRLLPIQRDKRPRTMPLLEF
jgi:hypothetical protein